MPRALQLAEHIISDRDTDWRARQNRFRVQQEAHWQQKRSLQELRTELQAQRRFLLEYRQSFQQELLRVLTHRLLQEQEPSDRLQGVRQRLEAFEAFQQCLQREQEILRDYQQSFQDKVRLLHERRIALRDIPDVAQRQQALQRLQAEYQQLQQDLREEQQLLREQQATYRQQRLDYEERLAQLRAEKSARQQRQPREIYGCV